MSTASKIKSAIRSGGKSRRKAISALSDVSSKLSEADYSSKLFEIKSKQSEDFFNTVYSGIDTLATLAGGLEQKAELESNIKFLEGELGEGQQFEIKQKPRLIDVFKDDVTLSDYLTGEDQYFLGEKSFGSKYDVAALGSKIKSERDAAALLSKSIETNTISEVAQSTLEEPKMPSITGGPSPIQIDPKQTGLETPKIPKAPKVINEIEKGILSNVDDSMDLRGQEDLFGFGENPEETNILNMYDQALVDDFETFADAGFVR
jgi:hypothetical protein